MQFNTCEVCGATGGRAGLLISCSSTGDKRSKCINCNDSFKTGTFTIHAHLNRTPVELEKQATELAQHIANQQLANKQGV